MADTSTSSLRWLATAALGAVSAALLWVLFAAEPAQVEGGDAAQQSGDAVPAQPADAVALSPGELPPLPGEGPVLVELRYRGAEGEERVLPRVAGSLDGRVVNDLQEPIAGARLTVVGGPQDGLTTRTDPYGRFRFASILPGTHLFRIEVAGIVAGRLQRVLSRAPTRRDFVVGGGVSPVLQVLGHDGKPLEGAEVTADLAAVPVLTNAEGLAQLQAVPRSPRVLVDVRAVAHVPVRFELNFLPPVVPAEPVRLPPLPRGGVIRGHVKSWPGGPPPTVTVVPRSDRIGAHKAIWETWQDLPVDWEGHFVLENLPTTQTVDIRVSHPEGVAQPQLRAVRANESSTSSVEFVVVRGNQRVAGTVLGPQDEPLAGATVVLEAADPQAVLGALYPGLAEGVVTTSLPVPGALRRAVETGRDGAFDFALGDHPTGSGHLILTARKAGFAPARSVVKNLRSSYRLRLRPEDRSASVRLTTRAGLELPPVRWSLDGTDREGTTPDSLGGLLAGYYEIRVGRGEALLYESEDFRVRGEVELPLR